jgi:tetratricopeptide (TPR) repeat protein/serine/threonine protein kinase
MNEETLFHLALEKAAGERSAFLDEACAGDAALRRRVEALLHAYDHPGSFLGQPAPNLGATAESQPGQPPGEDRGSGPGPEGPGSRIGPYKLLQQIGEGGMGAVFMAEQTRPVQRKVALKVIKPGLDSAQVIARFEAERQALALMDHPHIAKVLDAGTTDTGRPYFVMELVKGTPITRYCDEHRLTPKQRLELFQPVCQAVQHAHQKGIIHRDLKPSNVLVADYDDKPVAKVIDFGVAKATGPKLTDRTMFTEFGQVVGTLEYMSPEQAKLNALDVDTRSDIYALGVLLYELLTGTTPFDQKRLHQAAFDEILRIIREEEPPKPSTRLSTMEELPSVAANRGLEPRKLSGLVRGELDWIVMRCLEKDRNRRYETANGLAHDLERYLHDEPVEACPPSAGYKLRKLAHKYRRALGTVAVFVLLLMLGAVVSTWLAVWAWRAESGARTAAQQARDAEGKARSEAAITEAVNLFVQEDLLGQADVEAQGQQPDRDVKVRVLLDRAAAAVEGRFKDRPEVEAAIRVTIGNAYRALGEHAKAEEQLRRALEIRRQLGVDHADTVQAMNGLARVYLEERHPPRDETEPLLAEAVGVSRRALGDEHPLTLLSLHNLARLYGDIGQPARAEPLYLLVLQGRRRTLGGAHLDTLKTQVNLALLYSNQRRYAEAESLLRQTLDSFRGVLGDEHPLTFLCLNNLALQYHEQRQYTRAEPLLVAAVQGSRRVLGVEHPATILYRNHLLRLYRDQGEYAKAEPWAVEAVKVLLALPRERRASSQAVFGANELLRIYEAQGGLKLVDQGQYGEAEPVVRYLLGRRYTNRPWLGCNLQSLLGACLAGQQKYAEAEPLLLAGCEGLTAGQAAIPVVHRRHLIDALERVVQLYEAWGKPEKAAEWRQKLGPEKEKQARREAALARRDRGQALEKSGKHDEAVTAFRDAVRLEPDLADAHRALGEVLCYQRHDYQGALAALEQTLRLEPEDGATHYDLGNVFWGQGKWAEAEAEFRKALLFSPQLTTARYQLAGVLARQGNLVEAEANYRMVLRSARDWADTHLALGSVLVRQGRLGDVAAVGPQEGDAGVQADGGEPGGAAEAEAAARQAIGRNPADAAAHVRLGVARARQGKLDEAAAAFREAIRLQPEDADGAFQLGLVLHLQAKLPEATAAFREAFRLRPGHAGAHYNLGEVLRQQGKLPEAVAEYREAVRLNPDHGEAVYNLGLALGQLGRVAQPPAHPASPEAVRLLEATRAEAVAAAREDVRRKPEDAQAHFQLGIALEEQGDWDEAVAPFREAVRLKPGYREAYLHLGKMLGLNHVAEAEAPLREATRLGPDDAAAYVELGNVLRRVVKPAAAATAYRKAIDLNPGDAQTHEYLGMALEAQGKLPQAVAEYREAIRLKPDFAGAYLGLGTLLQQANRPSGKLAEAEAEFREAIRLRPNDSRGYVELAKLLTTFPEPRRRDPGRALEAAQKAVQLAPQSPSEWQLLGWARYRAGDYKASLEALEKSCALQEAPKGGDAGQWFCLALAHRQLGNQEEARHWYDRAAAWVEKNGQDEEIRCFQAEAAELLAVPGLARGGVYAERGDWDKAAADFARAFEQQSPGDPFVWFEHAYLRLQVGDAEGYRTLCARMRERFGRSGSGADIPLLAHSCVLAPDALGDAALVLRLAQQRLTLTGPDPWSLHVLALAHYRAGEYDKAVRRLTEALECDPAWEFHVLNWLALSMAHQQLGHGEEARKWFDKAGQGIAEADRKRPDQSTRFAPPGWHWRDWLGVQMLRREAEELLTNRK